MARSAKSTPLVGVTMIEDSLDPDDYATRILKAERNGNHQVQGLREFMQRNPPEGLTAYRIFYTNTFLRRQFSTVDELLRQTRADADAKNLAICVIENTSANLMAELGRAWDIDPAFFALHVSNPADDELLWQPCEWRWDPNISASFPLHFDQLVGVYEYHDLALDVFSLRAQEATTNHYRRRILKEGDWPVTVTSNVTYLRVNDHLYLFMVDRPIPQPGISGVQTRRPAPSLRFPYSQSYGGLLFPSTDLDTPLNMFDALQDVFKHNWIASQMFVKPGVPPHVPLAYLLSGSAWLTKVTKLDKRTKAISFGEIRKADERTTVELHDLREELAILRGATSDTLAYMSSEVEDFHRGLRIRSSNLTMPPPSDALRDVLSRADNLNAFLLETFQLLMNTIAIRDSQMGIDLSYSALQQTNQGILLTRLATVYLPLSLATGIFGMNISQINGTGHSIWVFVVTCVGIIAVTLTLLTLQVRQLHNNPPVRRDSRQGAIDRDTDKRNTLSRAWGNPV